ncbi:MAG: glycosyltransferase family 2 protein [Vicinamibacterales bacterium]
MTDTAQPLVSVVVPTYNQAPYIGDTVKSILGQTHPEVEIVVVDDGSTDSTADAVPRGDRIDVVRQRNQGVAAARNTGFARTRGSYLLFVDGDDQLLPTKIARDIELLEARADLAASYCAWQFFSDDARAELGESHPRRDGDLLEGLLLKQVSPVPAAVTVRRSSLDAVGLFDPACATAGDYDLWIRLALGGHRFGYIDEALVRYRIAGSSMSSQLDKMEAAIGLVFDKAFGSPALPAATRGLEGRARAILQFELASECFRTGARDAGRRRIERALEHDPDLGRDLPWLAEWLAAVAHGPRAGAGPDLIDTVVEELPPVIDRRRLRRRVEAHVHVVATYLADQRRDRRKVRINAAQALRRQPSVLFNRGFVRILLRALAG